MSTLDVIIKNIREAVGIEPVSRDYSFEMVPTDSAESKPAALPKKDQVINAIIKRGVEVREEDLPGIMEEMKVYFEENENGNYFVDITSQDYYRLLDLRDQVKTRVVVVGDIHCDYHSLVALLLKLSVSDYDYFENAYFVFLGDYLDRGSALFEPLLLLMDIKRILGDRLIMLRGNHELISYDESSQELESSVLPQQTCPCLNEYCGMDKEFLETFGYFYKTLPTYVWLKVADQNVLLTHAAVPRMRFFETFHFDQTTGELQFEPAFLYEQLCLAKERTTDDSLTTMSLLFDELMLSHRNQILYDMIWGDPSHDKEKYQVAGRFDFGSEQFAPYAEKNMISRVFRSHEPVTNGFESFFGNQLYTIFSTGGNMNDQSGYAGVDPAFAVVKGDGTYFIENSYVYQMGIGQVARTIYNMFSEDFLTTKQVDALSLNKEFACTDEEALRVRAIIEKVKEGFLPQEEIEEPETSEEKVETQKAVEPEQTIEPGETETTTEARRTD